MLKNKAMIAIGITFLFLVLTISPASANVPSHKFSLAERETNEVGRLVDAIERFASEEEDYDSFLEKVKAFCENKVTSKFPILKFIISKLMGWITGTGGLYVGGININDFFNKGDKGLFNKDRSSEKKFVISFGSYKLRSPKKGNEVRLSKGFSFWHYSTKVKWVKGRTSIVERPLNVKKVVGFQIGFMRGFRGFYLDFESKLTGLSYKFFMGRASVVRVLDLTPFK